MNYKFFLALSNSVYIYLIILAFLYIKLFSINNKYFIYLKNYIYFIFCFISF